MLGHWLIDSAVLYPVTRNRFGDTIYGTAVNVNIRFREIDFMQTSGNREELDADAIVWFAPGTSVTMGDVLEYDGGFYRIDRINKARRGGSTAVEFLKCDVKRQRQIS